MSERNDSGGVEGQPSRYQSGASAEAHHRHPPSGTDSARVAALESENIRLQLLVAELLIKNQQLRRPESSPTGVE